jgi:hypothetical protein
MLLVSTVGYMYSVSYVHLGLPGALALDSDNMVVQDVMNRYVAVQSPCHQLEQVVVGVNARSAKFPMKL